MTRQAGHARIGEHCYTTLGFAVSHCGLCEFFHGIGIVLGLSSCTARQVCVGRCIGCGLCGTELPGIDTAKGFIGLVLQGFGKVGYTGEQLYELDSAITLQAAFHQSPQSQATFDNGFLVAMHGLIGYQFVIDIQSHAIVLQHASQVVPLAIANIDIATHQVGFEAWHVHGQSAVAGLGEQFPVMTAGFGMMGHQNVVRFAGGELGSHKTESGN